MALTLKKLADAEGVDVSVAARKDGGVHVTVRGPDGVPFVAEAESVEAALKRLEPHFTLS